MPNFKLRTLVLIKNALPRHIPLYLLTSFYLLITTGCKKDISLFSIQNLNNDEIKIFGHGGMGIKSLYPINSKESIHTALSIGADGTELDIQLTKDNVLVAFHDFKISKQTDCSGHIRDFTWNELADCQYNSPPLKKQKITSINKLFESISDIKKYTFTFDCKLDVSYANDPQYLEDFSSAILKIINKNPEISVFIESQSTVFLNLLKSKDEELKLFIYPASFEEGFNIAKANHLFGITINNDLISQDNVELAHLDSIYITLWNVSSEKENIDAIKKSPDYIQSDALKHIISVVE